MPGAKPSVAHVHATRIVSRRPRRISQCRDSKKSVIARRNGAKRSTSNHSPGQGKSCHSHGRSTGIETPFKQQTSLARNRPRSRRVELAGSGAADASQCSCDTVLSFRRSCTDYMTSLRNGGPIGAPRGRNSSCGNEAFLVTGHAAGCDASLRGDSYAQTVSGPRRHIAMSLLVRRQSASPRLSFEWHPAYPSRVIELCSPWPKRSGRSSRRWRMESTAELELGVGLRGSKA